MQTLQAIDSKTVKSQNHSNDRKIKSQSNSVDVDCMLLRFNQKICVRDGERDIFIVEMKSLGSAVNFLKHQQIEHHSDMICSHFVSLCIMQDGE